VGDTILDRDAGHGHRRLEVRGSVVEARQQMMVKVDHSSYRKSITVQEI
jgi:hypothetical protein